MDFYGVIANLQAIGFLDLFLPFMLIFVVVYGVLLKASIFGTGDSAKKFNAVLALVMAASVVIPHMLGTYPVDSDPVEIINSALPNIAVILVAIVALLLMVGTFGAQLKIGGSLTVFIVIFSFLSVFFVFGVASNWFGNLPYWLNFLNDEATQTLFVTLIIMGLIIYFITAPTKSSSNGGDRTAKGLSTWLKAIGENNNK